MTKEKHNFMYRCMICRRIPSEHNFLSHRFIEPDEKICRICNVLQKDHENRRHKFRGEVLKYRNSFYSSKWI